jgi:hypothetical protein
MHSHEALKQAVDQVGAKKVAAAVGVSTSLIYKWCEAPRNDGEPDQSGARNPLDRLQALMECAGCRAPLDWLCMRAKGIFVEIPDPEKERIDREYVARTQRMIREFSELLQAMADAMANDGRIDAAESAKIRREWQELMALGEGFVRACEQGFFNTTGKE